MIRLRFRVGPAVGLLAALVLAPAPDLLAGAADLPPVESVRMLREARLAHRRGDVEAELAKLRAAAERFPGEITVVRALLEYHRDHGLPEAEERRLRILLRERLADEETPPSFADLRRIALDPDTGDDLLREIDRHVASRLSGPEGTGEGAVDLLRLLAEIRLRLGRDGEAATALASLWQRSGDTAVAWKLLHLRLRLDDVEGALELMESVDEMRELFPERHIVLLAAAGRFDEALEALDRRLAGAAGDRVGAALPPPVESDWVPRSLIEQVAWALRDAGRDEKAEALFRRAAALDPNDAELEAVLLHLYASDEERAAVAAEVDRVWQEETNFRRLFDEGTQRLVAGDADGAYDLLDRAVGGLPDLEAAWYNLGMAAYRLERWARAAEALGRAAELNPERSANVFFGGVSLFHLERCTEAVPMLERALALDPERTDAHYYLAGCLTTLGRAEEAERHRRAYSGS